MRHHKRALKGTLWVRKQKGGRDLWGAVKDKWGGARTAIEQET